LEYRKNGTVEDRNDRSSIPLFHHSICANVKEKGDEISFRENNERCDRGNHDGKVFQKDLGKNTAAVASAMKEYNPDSTWSEVKE
jgi:DUF2950 family protein